MGGVNLDSLYNNKTLKPLRRKLRKNQTDHESILWRKLRNRQFEGLKFLRQYSVGNYILDFYCPEKRIAIELDGSQHLTEPHLDYDQLRTKFLQKCGIHVLRYFNTDIHENLNGILEDLFQIVKTNPSKPPLILRGGEEKL